MKNLQTTTVNTNLEKNKLFAFIDNTEYNHKTKKRLKSILDATIENSGGDIYINFDDIKYIFDLKEKIYCGVGKYKGNDSVNIAIKKAFENTSLDQALLDKMSRILIHFVIHPDLPIKQISKTMESIYKTFDENSSIIFGVKNDKSVAKNYAQVTVLLTGLGRYISKLLYLSKTRGGCDKQRLTGVSK